MAEASIQLAHRVVDGHSFTMMKVDKKNLEAFRYRPYEEGVGYLVSSPDFKGPLTAKQIDELILRAIEAFDSTLNQFAGMIPYELLCDDNGVVGVFFERWHRQ